LLFLASAYATLDRLYAFFLYNIFSSIMTLTIGIITTLKIVSDISASVPCGFISNISPPK